MPRSVSDQYFSLRILCAVAEQQSVSLAASRLMMSQSGVSMAIHRLEERCGAHLFARTGNRFVLTQAGSELYRHALSTLRSARDLEAKIRALSGEGGGLVTLATRTSLSAHYLPPILAEFRRQHRDTQVRVVDVFSRLVVLQEVLDEGAEFAMLARSSGVVVGPGLTVEPFHREPLVVVACPDHPLAHRPMVSLAEIAQEPFIVNSREFGQISILEDRLRAVGVGQVRIAMEVNGEGAKELVHSGVGLALLLRCIVARELERGELRTITLADGDWSMEFVLVCPDTHPLSPLAQDLVDLVRRHGANDRDPSPNGPEPEVVSAAS